MTARPRFSTPTVIDSEYLVPWLSAEGRVMGEVKFGPHFVVVKTPLSNIRITTFFAGESEVKIVGPSRISDVQSIGCNVDFIPPTEGERELPDIPC